MSEITITKAGLDNYCFYPPHSKSKYSRKTSKRIMDRRNYLIGIGLLLCVVFLWTFSSFLTQDLFEVEGYDKPFLITYLNTSSFTLYLLPFAFKAWRARKRNGHPHEEYQSIPENEPLARSRSPSEATVPDLADEEGALKGDHPSEPPLTTIQIAQLASVFCFLWFIANWSVNASLKYTSVGSSTVLSSTSGLFTLLAGRVFGIEALSMQKIAAVIASFAGVVLVSLADSSNTLTNKPADLLPLPPNPLLGDFLALISALFYALYVSLLKVRIRDEHRINMQLFFGFVGLFNVITLWPLGFVVHFLGVEPFELPQNWREWSGIGINMLVTFSSDFIYVLAMLKTTPLVVTIGLSLTIPMAVLGDFALGRDATALGLFGATLVLLAFTAIGFEDAQPQELPEPLVVVGDDLSIDIRGEEDGYSYTDEEEETRGRSRVRAQPGGLPSQQGSDPALP